MVLTLDSPQTLSREGLNHGLDACDECERQLTAARRELGSFVAAVDQLFGPAAAAEAANDWVALAERVDLSSISHPQHWRSVTIQAASRLAGDDGQDAS